MKSWNAVWMGLAVSAAALGGASIASADDGKVVANVQFAFVVGGMQMPPGRYSITGAVDDADGVVVMASTDGRQAAYLMTTPGPADDTTATQPTLVFERSGNQLVLTRFTLEGSDGHRTVLELAGAKHEVAP